MTADRGACLGGWWVLLACVVAAAGCAARNDMLVGVPEIRPGYLAGYLKPEALPNSLALVPAAPAAGSLEMAVDEAFNGKALELRDTWSLILTQISPAQTDAIPARGEAYAASRIICNVHWRNDTLQGRYMGAYTVARLQSDPTFEADLAAARTELAAVRDKGVAGVRDCAAEAAAIALQKNLVP